MGGERSKNGQWLCSKEGPRSYLGRTKKEPRRGPGKKKKGPRRDQGGRSGAIQIFAKTEEVGGEEEEERKGDNEQRVEKNGRKGGHCERRREF